VGSIDYDKKSGLNCRGLRRQRTSYHSLIDSRKNVLKRGKPLLLAMNKSDLVPLSLIESWKEYFRSRGLHAIYLSATGHLGTRLLRKSIQEELPQDGSVLLVGYPKTGKSSIINALKSRHSVSTSKLPMSAGSTRGISLLRIGRILIYDTPGVIPPDGDPFEKAIRGYPIEKLMDPIPPALRIVRVSSNIDREALVRKYGEFTSPENFLEIVAKKRGWFYGKSGEPNVEEAARAVIREYHEGRITYYTFPPSN